MKALCALGVWSATSCLSFEDSGFPCGGEAACPPAARCIEERCVLSCYRDEECGPNGQCLFNRCVRPESVPDQGSADMGEDLAPRDL